MFHFNFYDTGGLKTITIDDRLPISSSGEFLYSQNVSDVFWYPLLEKAYAKFRGGYDKIETGLLIESFAHLTGKKAEWFDNGADTCLPFTPSGMYDKLEFIINKKFLVVCKLKDPIGNNQLYGSAFTLIDVSEEKRLSNDGFFERKKLIQLRHPSGIIEKEMADEMGISKFDSFGEGFIDIEKFLVQMNCVYMVDMEEVEVLNRNQGLDAFLPFIPIPDETAPTNRHRCKQ
uniref:Calpain catalytic domain-containing protein n=1 Tax=Caenorhabditis tropicalis TaxID=1561998 RepID=A0A1I7UN96_9PELO